MPYQSIITAIDAELAKLKEVRRLLAQSGKFEQILSRHVAKKGPGKAIKTRVLSSEARQRIADAQRKRWAAARKAAK